MTLSQGKITKRDTVRERGPIAAEELTILGQSRAQSAFAATRPTSRKPADHSQDRRFFEESRGEREALLALCLSYDQLLQSIAVSRRWRLGNAIGNLAASSMPPFARALAVRIVRLARRFLRVTTRSKSQFDLEYEDLHRRLTGLLFDTPQAAIDPVSEVTEQAPAQPTYSESDVTASVVSVLYNDAGVIDRFLGAFERQEFAGKIQVVLVDDKSTDEGAARARDYGSRLPADSRLEIVVIENDHNVGNCVSRNTGIEQANGDFLVVIDADCVVNDRFLTEHAQLHAKGFDIVIGPMGLESRAEHVDTFIPRLQSDRSALAAAMRIQYPPDPTNCVNCVTRNFSVTREMLTRLNRPLFDPRFSYRNDPNTGFGWEDVEMGTALFEAGASIAFTWDAFSVHLSHPPTVADEIKARGSKRNFELLLETHPRLPEIATEWTIGTATKIHAWVRKYNPSDNGIASMASSDRIAELRAGDRPVVYSAIAGGYDRVQRPPSSDSVRCVMFTDAQGMKTLWEPALFDVVDADPVRTAKKPKVLPHIYFPNAEWSIWIDGNVELLANPIELIDEVASSGNRLGVFKHPERECIFDEALRCISGGRDDTDTILAQVERYHHDGYPRKNGLAECNVIVRKHNDPEVTKAMCDWWREIERGSKRDQLSFNYVLWKNGIGYHELGEGILNVRSDRRFSYRPHGKRALVARS